MLTRLFGLTALFLGALTHVPAAAAQSGRESIGLFFDADCSTCSATMLPGEQRTLEIQAVRGGPTAPFGLAGAHFAVVGLPSGWTAECSSNPTSTFALGDPFGEGASLLIPCTSGSCVPLYQCTITATTDETAYLSVVGHSVPQGCPGGCACVAYCAPAPTATCAIGGQAIINGGPCTVAVQPSSWGRFKRLYD